MTAVTRVMTGVTIAAMTARTIAATTVATIATSHLRMGQRSGVI
jgi:hypothetical protein